MQHNTAQQRPPAQLSISLESRSSSCVSAGAPAKSAERWNAGHRIRDVEQGPDGALWLLEDASPGGLFKLTPK